MYTWQLYTYSLFMDGCNFSIFVHTLQWTSQSFFFHFRFFSRKSQSQEKLTHPFNELHPTWHLHCINSSQPLNCVLDSSCWSSLKKNVCIFLKIFLRLFLFHRHHKILSSGVRGGGRQNNFFKPKVGCQLEMFYNFSFGLKFL